MSFSTVRPLRSRLAEDSIEHFEIFANDLKEALVKSIPTNLSRYKHAAVLAIHWSNDDIGVMPQTDEFLQTLRQSYNYVTEKYVIDAARPYQDVGQDFIARILAFTNEHQSRTRDNSHLLIYYYSGHSDSGPRENQLRLSGHLPATNQLATPWLDWYSFSQVALDFPAGDTIMIMDSCDAAMTDIKAHSEILTATGWENTTPILLNKKTFTRSLIDEFTRADGRAFTASQLHSRLMGNKMIIQNVTTAATPIHMAHPYHKPSVLFHKILGNDRAENIQLMPQDVIGKVLIKISVLNRNSVPNDDVAQWAEWLSTNMPTDLQNIEILHIYESSSTAVCVLVAVPVVLWNHLPPRPGYEYVGRYWGSFPQMVSQAGASQNRGLALRPSQIFLDKQLPSRAHLLLAAAAERVRKMLCEGGC